MSEKTIPIQRIQDVGTWRLLIERPFGVGDVVVETAGVRGAARVVVPPSAAGGLRIRRERQ